MPDTDRRRPSLSTPTATTGTLVDRRRKLPFVLVERIILRSGRLSNNAKLLYLFLALPQNSFLGVALMSASTVLYPHYLTNDRDWGIAPIDDHRSTAPYRAHATATIVRRLARRLLSSQ